MIDTQRTCYLFFDYDGTVFLDGKIPPENRRAIEGAQHLGHQVILNTGRSRGGLDFSLEKNQGIRWDGMIFGATDMNFRGKRYHEHTLTHEDVLYWVNHALDRRCWFAVEGEVKTKRYLTEPLEHALSLEERSLILAEIEAFCRDNPITKMTIQILDEADEPKGSLIRFLRQTKHTELFPNGRDKGVGFLDFCRFYELPFEQCVCFGEGINGLAIFEACPTSVCMENSPDCLKACATYVAKTEFGVAEGLEWLFGKDFYLTNP